MDYNYTYETDGGGIFAGIMLAVWLVFILAVYVVTVIGLWKMYVKAGKPGWAAIIPIYNWWVWVEMIGRPRWWFWVYLAAVLLAWIPLVGFVLAIVIFVIYLMGCLDMAKCFGRGTGTGIGLWLVPFVFAPILGFGDAQYVGPATATAGGYGGAAPPPPPAAGTYAAPPAPPAPPAAPVTPTQAATPSAPVTPPVTPAEAAPAQTAMTDAADAASDAPAAPETPPAPPAGSPPPPPPLA